MKTNYLQQIIFGVGIMLSVVSFFMVRDYMDGLKEQVRTEIEVANATQKQAKQNYVEPIVEEITEEVTTETTTVITTTKPVTTKKVEPKTTTITTGEEVIFENLTETELTAKLNKNLSSTIKGTGNQFARYTKKTGLDPYLAVAIVLHETGCKWTCSTLTRDCNNVGGIKGTPSCNGGSYKRYDTLEQGIEGYLDLVYNNYYSKGLTTPELINPRYAESKTWATRVGNYMTTIRNS